MWLACMLAYAINSQDISRWLWQTSSNSEIGRPYQVLESPSSAAEAISGENN
jgi:hypothetical protein